ncbi:MAG: tRNA-dihydrouridine synthase B, partial [Aureispira sp.]
PRIKIPIFGNGDINSPEKAALYRDRYGVDGIMIGRAAIGYPWIFREIKHFLKTGEHLPPPTIKERVDAAREHLEKSVIWKGEKLGILEMRRHYTNYFKGLRGVKAYRAQLVHANEAAMVFDLLDEVEQVYS